MTKLVIVCYREPRKKSPRFLASNTRGKNLALLQNFSRAVERSEPAGFLRVRQE
jgi:hypothetical protein